MREDFWRIWSLGFYLRRGSCTYARYSRRPYAKQNKFESALDLALGSSARYPPKPPHPPPPQVHSRTNYIYKNLTVGTLIGYPPSIQRLAEGGEAQYPPNSHGTSKRMPDHGPKFWKRNPNWKRSKKLRRSPAAARRVCSTRPMAKSVIN